MKIRLDSEGLRGVGRGADLSKEEPRVEGRRGSTIQWYFTGIRSNFASKFFFVCPPAVISFVPKTICFG